MNDFMNGATPDGAQHDDAGAANAEPLRTFIDHQRKALEETGKALDALIPDGFKEHSAEARREFVKGMKVLVDAALTELERASRDFDKNFTRRPADAPTADADRPTSTGANKVKVQVD
ncbi:MAG: hypothetical protein SGJ24_18515 [Chloroflexota bacterium]|nr:hypothetical protein [Chloroflexota bacterium]